MSCKCNMSDQEETKDQSNENLIFLNLLKQNKVLFNKERTPQIQRRKNIALEALTASFNLKANKNLNTKQIHKKFHNFKNRAKEAYDKKNERNKKNILKEWEKKMLQLLDQDQPGLTCENLLEPGAETMDLTSSENKNVLNDKADTVYKNFDSEELKQLLIISQIRAAKAQEKAAIAQERTAIAQERVALAEEKIALERYKYIPKIYKN